MKSPARLRGASTVKTPVAGWITTFMKQLNATGI
jgi:hypothetical protein